MKRIGIVAHSAEGGALCFLTACREGQARLGEHLHPEIVVSAIPMGLSMAGWESGDHTDVAHHLTSGIDQVAAAGADFFVCPDNTAHIVLETVTADAPIPGLHIAEVVAAEMASHGWSTAGLLGTRWTMTGRVYPDALAGRGLGVVTPDDAIQIALDRAIFEELCLGRFEEHTIALFQRAIDGVRGAGADCVILGCTEIPLIINDDNSSLPVLDSTRLLARRAVEVALETRRRSSTDGWLAL